MNESSIMCINDLFFFFVRYINHSCAPNCVAEVVTFERGYKIIISCNRRVEKGEEVSVYVYSSDYFLFRYMGEKYATVMLMHFLICLAAVFRPPV